MNNADNLTNETLKIKINRLDSLLYQHNDLSEKLEKFKNSEDDVRISIANNTIKIKSVYREQISIFIEEEISDLKKEIKTLKKEIKNLL